MRTYSVSSDVKRATFSKGFLFGILGMVLMIVIAVISWVTCLMWKLHTPVTVTDLVTFLGSAGTFVMLVCGTLTGLKYTADAVNNRAATASAQVQSPEKEPAK